MAGKKQTEFTDANLTDAQRKKLGIGVAVDPNAKSLGARIGAGLKNIQQASRASSQIVDPASGQLVLREPEQAQARLATLEQRAAPTPEEQVAAATAAAKTPEGLRNAFLDAQGVNEAALGQEGVTGGSAQARDLIQGRESSLGIRTSSAFTGMQDRIGNKTPQARLGQELLANTQHTKFNYGDQEIFGRADENSVGGRINNFTGAGTPNPNDPTTNVTDNQVNQALVGVNPFGQQLTTQADGSQGVYNPTGYNNANVTAPSRVNAGNPQFRGGVGSGADNNALRRVTAINRRADRAFQDAMSAGMNTKAAARIAGSIRDGATQINFQDRTAAGERTAAANISAQKEIAELRNISARETLNAEQAQALNDADYEDLKGLAFTTNEETGEQVFDQQGFSEALFAAGGRSNLQGLSGASKHALFRQGSNVTKFISGINSHLASKGKRVDNIGDLLKGASITGDGKLAQSHTTLMQALRSDTISIGDIFGETLTLSDGTLLPLGDLLGEDAAAFTNEERAALIEIIPED